MRKGLSPMPPRSRCSCFSKCVCSALQKFAGAVWEMDWKNTQLALFFFLNPRAGQESLKLFCAAATKLSANVTVIRHYYGAVRSCKDMLLE